MQNVEGLKLSPNNLLMNNSIRLKSKSALKDHLSNVFPSTVVMVNNKVNYFRSRSKIRTANINTLNMTLSTLGSHEAERQDRDLSNAISKKKIKVEEQKTPADEFKIEN